MTIEASRLRVDLQKRERWRRTLKVTVPADLVRKEREKVAARLAKRLRLPGFRSGRIPSSVVEKRYGMALRQEMLDRIIRDAYQEALRLEALRPISEGEVENVEYEPEQDLSFSVSFDVQPEIELARLGGFRVTRPRVEAGDEEIGRVLDRLREQGGIWRPAEEGKPQAGDRVFVTVARLVGGAEEGDPKDYELVLGEGDAVPEVEEAIASLDPGSSGDFTVRLPGEGPEAGGDGEEQHLRITLRERSVRELPGLDDEFARSVGEFEDLEALRNRVREDLQREAEQQSEAVLRTRLLDQVLDANPFDVPVSMVERYAEAVLGDTSKADPQQVAALQEQLRPEAERAVRRMLVIERLAETQGLHASEAELDERIERIASRNEISPAQAYAQLQKSGRLETLEREITEEKVFGFLREKSKIEDELQ